MRSSPPFSHGQSLELCVADPGTELGPLELEVALTDLIFTTALLQEVDLGECSGEDHL